MESILYILFILVTIGASWFITKTIKGNFQEYKGKILWSLIFFPLLFILGGVCGSIITLFQLFKPYSLGPTNLDIFKSVLALIISLIGGYLFFKEYKLLLNINIENISKIKTINLYIICLIGGISILISFLKGNENPSENLAIEIVFSVVAFGLIWYFSNQKIESFRKLIIGEDNEIDKDFVVENNSSLQNGTSISDNKSSSKDKLYQIKELLDQGILTHEEFEDMKKDILNKGI